MKVAGREDKMAILFLQSNGQEGPEFKLQYEVSSIQRFTRPEFSLLPSPVSTPEQPLFDMGWKGEEIFFPSGVKLFLCLNPGNPCRRPPMRCPANYYRESFGNLCSSQALT